MRFEIERDLIAGKLSVEELPQVWNAKFKDYIGIDVPSNKLGCLQGSSSFSSLWSLLIRKKKNQVFGGCVKWRNLRGAKRP